MKRLNLITVLIFVSLSAFSQYDYVGHNGADCSSSMTISYTYTNYELGSHGHGYRVYRDGTEIRHEFDEFGGYYVKSLDFLNDSVGFVTHSESSGINVYKTIDYGENWEFIGGGGLLFHDIYFVNQYTAYLIGQVHHLENNITIVKITGNNYKKVLAIDTVSTTTTNYSIIDTIMGEPLCGSQKNLIFEIQKSETSISFEINFNHVLSGVQDINYQNEISIYPNPADDLIFLDINNSEILDVSIYNYSGRLLFNELISNKSVNISRLGTGIYVLIARRDEKSYKTKFIVE